VTDLDSKWKKTSNSARCSFVTKQKTNPYDLPVCLHPQPTRSVQGPGVRQTSVCARKTQIVQWLCGTRSLAKATDSRTNVYVHSHSRLQSLRLSVAYPLVISGKEGARETTALQTLDTIIAPCSKRVVSPISNKVSWNTDATHFSISAFTSAYDIPENVALQCSSQQ
jgi:hypothetical protein